MGIDRIFVDEADLYKNLGFIIEDEPHRRPAEYREQPRARYVHEDALSAPSAAAASSSPPARRSRTPWPRCTRCSAISRRRLLKAAGVEHFDAWAANFGEAVTALELAPDGSGYRMHTRFAKFVNLPELLSMFRTFADVQTADMLHLPRPDIEGGKPHITAAPASPELKAFVETLVERAQKLRTSAASIPRVDNMLKITGDGRKAALDMRLVDPLRRDRRRYQAEPRRRADLQHMGGRRRTSASTQLVFCDLSTPNPDRFNVYDEIRDKLIAKGVPAKEIASLDTPTATITTSWTRRTTSRLT